MDNISYHGTNLENANEIVGPPSGLNINKGKGELGKGFYTGSSVAQAAIWAQIRYKERGAVIEFDIEIGKFVQLRGKSIKTQAEVISIWSDLKLKKEHDKHEFNYDYVIAPFATIEHTGYQFKFESQKAEDELNSCKKTIHKCES